MTSYTEFAYIYDELIGQDYEAWADYLEQAFERYGEGTSLVLDLGCGTGNITSLLAQRGYDMIGLDLSPDMLSVAQNKAEGLPIQFICQDMTQFELYGTVDAAICTLDCINYITNSKKLLQMFKLVKNYLNPGGLFIFDISSEYKISQILGNNSFIYDFGDIFYTWENIYSLKSKICTYNLTFFIKNGEKYDRIDEVQKQRAYSENQIIRMLEDAGLSAVGCFDELTFEQPCENSQRLMFIAKNIC